MALMEQSEQRALIEMADAADLERAAAALADAMPDPEAFLRERGVQLPPGARVTVRSIVDTTKAAGKGRKCVEYCVRVKGIEFCRTTCTG